jgi:hypothetical protein
MPLHNIKEVYTSIEETIAGLGNQLSSSTVDTLNKLLEEARASSQHCPPCPVCAPPQVEALGASGDYTASIHRLWSNLKLVIVLFAVVWVLYGVYRLIVSARTRVWSSTE